MRSYMITCYQFKTTISKYIDKDIPFRLRKSFEDHMESCPDCKHLFQSILSTKQSMQQFPEISVSDNFMNNLRNKILDDRNARIEASLNSGFSLSRIPSFAYGFAAALVAVIIGFYLMEFRPISTSGPTPPAIVREQIQQKNTPRNNAQTTPPLMSRGQFATSEHSSDSLDNPDSQNVQTRPDFQDKIKTVKQEY